MVYPATEENLDFAITILELGEVVIYPTDTLYGFGVDATQAAAVTRLNALKNRLQPMSIIIGDLSQIPEFAEVQNKQQEFIDTLLPGPYTLLFKNKTDSSIADGVTLDSPLIGIRFPDHPFPVEIARRLGRPITTTSINRHGVEPLVDVKNVSKDFPGILTFEDRVRRESLGSTVIDISGDVPAVVRQGDGGFPI